MSISHTNLNLTSNFERKKPNVLQEHCNKENKNYNVISEQKRKVKSQLVQANQNGKTRKAFDNLTHRQYLGIQDLCLQNSPEVQQDYNLYVQDSQMDQETVQQSYVLQRVFENLFKLQKYSMKQENSQKISKDYSEDILQHMLRSTENNFHFLQQHNVSQALRSKMIDWMIEVCGSYKISEQAYFKSVYYMDKYFKKNPKKIEAKQIHLIGICCIFLAAKQEQIYPFRIKTVCQKVSRSKFCKKDIITKQSEILHILNFDLQAVSVLPIIMHLLYLMKNDRINRQYIELKQATQFFFKNSDDSLQQSQKLCDQIQKEIPSIFQQKLHEIQKASSFLHKVCIYLAKMTRYSYKLSQTPIPFVAAGVIHVALKTTQQLYETRQKMDSQNLNQRQKSFYYQSLGNSLSTFDSDYYLQFILSKMKLKDKQIVQISSSVLLLAQNFSKQFPSLQNLNRFNSFQ